jgi:hypothetical protein
MSFKREYMVKGVRGEKNAKEEGTRRKIKREI